MAKRIRKRKCKNCCTFFPPDSRNAWHQKYCTQPACRKASKAASQKKWLEKEENKDHFRGPENVQRVQEWRETHPGYWKKPEEQKPLQEILIENRMENPTVETSLPNGLLQDLLNGQPMVLIGLIAQLTGSALQDDIALTARRLQQLGCDILNIPTSCKGDKHDHQTSHLCAAPSEGARAVQLGGSASGP
jgi:hypothetical protein